MAPLVDQKDITEQTNVVHNGSKTPNPSVNTNLIVEKENEHTYQQRGGRYARGGNEQNDEESEQNDGKSKQNFEFVLTRLNIRFHHQLWRGISHNETR